MGGSTDLGRVAGELLALFLIEDDHRVREGLAEILSFEPDLHVVGTAGSIAQTQRDAPPLAPAVLLVDYGLPDGNGADLIELLRPMLPTSEFIIHAGALNHQQLARCVAVGAFACVPKQVKLAPLLHTIRTAGARPRPPS